MENIIKLLQERETELLGRLTKGQELINKAPAGSVRNSYEVQYNRLRNKIQRIQACLDILDDSYTVIAEKSGELVVAKRTNQKIWKLVEEAQRLGGVITSIEDVSV